MSFSFKEPVFLEDKVIIFDPEIVARTIIITDQIIEKYKKKKMSSNVSNQMEEKKVVVK